MNSLIHHLLLCLVLYVQESHSDAISSCPMYACRPSGTYSVLLELPSSQPKVIWNTTYGSLPTSSGCVGNINNIVCPYESSKLHGYVAIDGETGKQLWYDGVLRYPSLPVMDVQGDVIGTDGHYIVKYEADGTQDKPSIPISSFLYPVFSVQLTANGYLVFASVDGIIFAYDTQGIVLASIPLSGKVEQVNGTFIPVTRPVVMGARVYVLTEFKPEEDTPYTRQPSISGLHRLFAIDVFGRMVDRLDITWTFDFKSEPRERRADNSNSQNTVYEFEENNKDDAKGNEENLSRVTSEESMIMANVQQQLLHVILPSENSVNSRMFWTIKDGGNSSMLLYKRTISASTMAMYERNGDITTGKNKQKTNIKKNTVDPHVKPSKFTMYAEEIPVWLLSQGGNMIYKVKASDGSISLTLNLTSLLGGPSDVTSDFIVYRGDDNSEDNVIFGVTVTKSSATNYLVSASGSGKIQWIVQTPSNAVVVGQIAGISSEGSNSDNLFVAFGKTKDTSVVFGIQ